MAGLSSFMSGFSAWTFTGAAGVEFEIVGVRTSAEAAAAIAPENTLAAMRAGSSSRDTTGSTIRESVWASWWIRIVAARVLADRVSDAGSAGHPKLAAHF